MWTSSMTSRSGVGDPHTRQHPIEDDRVEALGGRQLECRGTIGSGDDAVSLVGEGIGEALAERASSSTRRMRGIA